ncbi:MAG: heterodisulfide reductase-related iron-sulfur binding cluster [Stellaceae bacterium]
MREGSLDAPTRHAIPWQDADYYDPAKVEAEMHRIFEICHGCRRCFNLCDSFPRLFDLIDASPNEIEGVDRKDYAKVAEACTLCDLCFMTKCPYVPPHEFDLDFPHTMLRHRAAQLRQHGGDFVQRQLAETDRNGRLGGTVARLANWAIKTGNRLTRPAMEKLAGVDRRAELPPFHGRTFVMRARDAAPAVDKDAPAYGRKALIYATCFVNYNQPRLGEALHAILAKNGVTTEVAYTGCCGMPQFERGDVARVAAMAKSIAQMLRPKIEEGYDVVAPVPSCALMLKFEWPLLLPDDEDVRILARATFDASEYLVAISKKEGLAGGLSPLAGGVTVHIACHARAQNMGQKAAELLRLLPATELAVIERCSGHGGAWGVMKENFDTAIKVGKPVARATAKTDKAYLASECPLAATHIRQGMAMLGAEGKAPAATYHPIELMALAYGVLPEGTAA